MENFFRECVTIYKLLLCGSTAAFLIYDLIAHPELQAIEPNVPAVPTVPVDPEDIPLIAQLIPFMQTANLICLISMLVLTVGPHFFRRQ